MRELLDRSPCSNTSRNSERKRGRGRSMEIEWFHGEVTRAIWRPAKELPRIKSVRILPEASNRGIHERGQRLLVGGEGRRKRRREEKKEKERNTQIKQPFLFVSPFWGEKTKTIPMKNESSFCHISRILVFDFDQMARNWEISVEMFRNYQAIGTYCIRMTLKRCLFNEVLIFCLYVYIFIFKSI